MNLLFEVLNNPRIVIRLSVQYFVIMYQCNSTFIRCIYALLVSKLLLECDASSVNFHLGNRHRSSG